MGYNKDFPACILTVQCGVIRLVYAVYHILLWFHCAVFALPQHYPFQVVHYGLAAIENHHCPSEFGCSYAPYGTRENSSVVWSLTTSNKMATELPGVRVLCTCQLLDLAVNLTKRAMVGTEWANSRTNRPRKRYLLQVHFWQERWLGLLAGIFQPKMLTIACSVCECG